MYRLIQYAGRELVLSTQASLHTMIAEYGFLLYVLMDAMVA